MLLEPIDSVVDHLLERSRFGEEVRCSGHELQSLRRLQSRRRLFIQFDYAVVRASDDEKGRCSDFREGANRRAEAKFRIEQILQPRSNLSWY